MVSKCAILKARANNWENTIFNMQKDAQTFLAIIEANKGIVYKIANSYCRNEENRKDLIQEIILQLWLSFPKVRRAVQTDNLDVPDCFECFDFLLQKRKSKG